MGVIAVLKKKSNVLFIFNMFLASRYDINKCILG